MPLPKVLMQSEHKQPQPKPLLATSIFFLLDWLPTQGYRTQSALLFYS